MGELHRPLALLSHLWSPSAPETLYWGTKVQRNLPNNSHFTLSSSLFTHDVWSVKLPMLVIIFKMASLWQLMQHAWNSSYAAEIKTKRTLASSSFYVFVSDHKIFWQVVSEQMKQFILSFVDHVWCNIATQCISDAASELLRSLDISTLNIQSGFYMPVYTVHFMINHQTLYKKIAKIAHFCKKKKKFAVMTRFI